MNLIDIFKMPSADDKSLESLCKALEDNNIPGFDYIEFRQSLLALISMNLEEVTALKSAFATASTMGLTKSKLLESGEYYKSVLKKEKEKFDAALSNQIKNRVDSKKEEVNTLKSSLDTWKLQIAELEKKIEDARNTIQNADNVIAQEQEKINSKKNAFEGTFGSMMELIEKDLKKINDNIA